MKRAWLIGLSVLMAEFIGFEAAANDAAETKVLGTASTPYAIFSNTSTVRALATSRDKVWAATVGGLEQYDQETRTRTKLYTTNDGLAALSIDAVKVDEHGVVVASVAGHDCALSPGSARFACSRRGASQTNLVSQELDKLAQGTRNELESNDKQVTGERIEGSSVSARLVLDDGNEWLATAGLGIWVRSGAGLERVTPRQQVAGNHVVAIADWGQDTWFATFDRGLSVLRNGHFSDAPLGPRMLNDVLGTSAGLFIATSEGLFRSDDGEHFERDWRVAENAITDLAYDTNSNTLYAAATNSLWEIELNKPRKYARSTYQPGGSRSLQAVDVAPTGTVFLASEDRGILRRDAHKRYTMFDRLAGYPSSWVIDVLALGEHSALGGTLRHGVFSIDDNSPVVGSIDPWVLFLGRDAQSDDTVFVGTQEGASIVKGGHVLALGGLPHGCVHTLARTNDGLWVGTEGGLALYR